MENDFREELKRRREKEKRARRLLGVADHDGRAKIKKAFLELAKKYHPDKSGGSEESRRKFREILNAYLFLMGETDADVPAEETDEEKFRRIGKYLAGEWGYFCWWRDSFMEEKGDDEKHKR